MKKIAVFFYPVNNLGDDLFLKVLAERYPDIMFEILVSEGYENINIKNVVVSKRAKIVEKMRRILQIKKESKFVTLKKIFANNILSLCERISLRKKYLAKILITGSLFQQSLPISEDFVPLEKYNKYSPNFLIGANFGPFIQDDFLLKHKIKFKNDFVSVSFRDKHSFGFFSELNNAVYAPDVVLSGHFDVKQRDDSDAVVISVMDFTIKPHLKKYADIYEKKIAEISKEFIDLGKKVVLLSLCDYQGDRRAAERIAKYLHQTYNKEAEIVSYSGNIETVLQIIADSTFVISTRFHSMILSFYFNKRVFPIVYGEKTLHCLQDFNYYGNYCSVEEIESLDFNRVKYNFLRDIDINISEKKRLANNHFKALDDFLSDYRKK